MFFVLWKLLLSWCCVIISLSVIQPDCLLPLDFPFWITIRLFYMFMPNASVTRYYLAHKESALFVLLFLIIIYQSAVKEDFSMQS